MGNKHIRQGLIALALAMQAFTSVSHAVSLPTQGLAVEGQAVLYPSGPATSIQRRLNQEAVDESGVFISDSEEVDLLAAQSLLDKLVAKSQPVLTVTGAELSPLPVSLPNQLRELSLALPSGFMLDGIALKEAAGQTTFSSFEFSNVVLDVRTQTLWGDVIVRTGGTLSPFAYTPPDVVAAEWTAVRLMAASGGATGVDLRGTLARDDASDAADALFKYFYLNQTAPATPNETLWWPEASEWDPNASVATLRSAGRNGIVSGPDENSASIWLAGLVLLPDVLPTQTTFNTSLGAGRVGDMLITVSVQAIPEPGTLALWALGMSGLVLVARKAKG